MDNKSASRIGLAFLALINGSMGFVESMLAVPTGSTALAAGALAFLKIGTVAWLALWVSIGAFKQLARIGRVAGVVMVLLGGGVLAVAIGRYRTGFVPAALPAMAVAAVALLVNILSTALLWRARGKHGAQGRLNEAAAGIAVLAATGSVWLTGSNIGDVVVGGVLAMMFIAGGIDWVRNGGAADIVEYQSEGGD